MKSGLFFGFVLLFSVPAVANSLTDQINAVDAAQQESEAAERAAQSAHMQAIQAEKKRSQDYEDQLRALELQDKSLTIQAKKARVDRSNDYIDQELKEKAARADVIKSEADANRNISEGTKVLLEKTGEAAVKGQLK